MNEAFVKTEISNNIGYITFYHPQSNSLPGSVLKELATHIENAGNHPDIKVIVLKSIGEKAFCAGASFDELLNIAETATTNTDEARKKGKTFFSGFALVINAIRKAPKFVIGRVHAKAVGGGVGIAASVDYCFATKDASVKLSELAVGIGPFVVGPAVQRKIGLSAFSQMSINATEWFSAQWAKEKGLFCDVFDNIEQMDTAIEKLTSQLIKSNPDAMTQLKKIFWEGTEHWDTLLTERAGISGELVLSEYTRNFILSFKKK
ncbi:MAG: enoyl-CoA hydratase/isomerase family protein [Bacteroidetes bacterium]|nr:MAG: enoyl-CoA hydratase/isomerase family protein [Bacteroidota bacterium]